VLYDLTSVDFEGAGPDPIARYGHSLDHRSDRPQIIPAVATDTAGTPLHLSVLRGNRTDTSTLQSFLKILQRRFGIREAVFVFAEGMSSKVNFEAIAGDGLNFVTRLSNATLQALLKELPDRKQLELGDADWSPARFEFSIHADDSGNAAAEASINIKSTSSSSVRIS